MVAAVEGGHVFIKIFDRESRETAARLFLEHIADHELPLGLEHIPAITQEIVDVTSDDAETARHSAPSGHTVRDEVVAVLRQINSLTTAPTTRRFR